MNKNKNITILISQDVIFKPFFVFSLINKLKEENLFINEIIEVKRNKNLKKIRIKNSTIWSKFSIFQISIIYFFKKIISIFPIPLSLKFKSTVKLVAKKTNIKYKFIDNINEYLSNIKLKKNDIVFSFQHKIIKDPEKYKFFLINCHPGDLSLYRGIKPIFWSMLDNQKYGVISIHHIDKGIDTGNLILEEKFKLEKSLTDNYFIAYELAPIAVTKAIKKLLTKNYKKSNPKIRNSNSYKKNPEKEQIQKFYNSGFISKLSIINFLRLIKCF